MTTKNRPIDICIEILQKTNDGNDLAPWHLKLLELAANQGLNEAGEIALYELYEQVKNGYKKPWHLGIKHMTKDHEGYIYYKGRQVEHYSFHDDPGQKRERKSLRKLQRNMLFLESIGQPPTLGNWWKWEDAHKTA